VAGRIRDEDIALVREKSPIGDIIGEHVQLRNAGGGNLKGLCPFHDEKSPSFNVTPARGLFHCFGCQAGGDVIKFVQDVEHLDFSDAVERLASRAADRRPGRTAASGSDCSTPTAKRRPSTPSSSAAPRARRPASSCAGAAST
jgi:DNA primase